VDNKDREIPKDVPLFTDLLRDAGYEVSLFGKAHVKALGERNWDYYLGYPQAATDYFWPVIQEGKNGQLSEPRTYQGYVEDIVTDRAVSWMRQKRDKPFCIMLWFQSPHAPFFRARRHLDLYNGITIPKPATFDDDLRGYPGKPRAFAEADDRIGSYALHSDTAANCARSLDELTKDYYAGIVAADDNMGKVFKALTDIGQLDDTVIIFSSDHGFFLGEWGKYDKRFMHEPSIRTPMLVRYPRIVPAGSTKDEMVLNLDIAPTLLQLAGVNIPQQMQGSSLAPLLQERTLKDWRKDWLYEYYEYPGIHRVRKHRGVRTEQYKLIHYYEAPEEFELYDLRDDPGELHNLYGNPVYRGLIQELRRRMDELRAETDDRYVYSEPAAQPAKK
jgi:arylsulfatase A-like enzyme